MARAVRFVLSRTQLVGWSEAGLSDAPYTVTITHAGPAGRGASLDLFGYVLSSGAGASSTSTSATAAASTDLGASSETSRAVRVGAIVGGSITGLAVLVATAFVVHLSPGTEPRTSIAQVRQTGLGKKRLVGRPRPCPPSRSRCLMARVARIRRVMDSGASSGHSELMFRFDWVFWISRGAAVKY
ncbi:hypothetical protein FRC08_011674 [Ceratobasidium sp. 394]|nr:hypothetical protein FRC08_011674 [Ceratobasidium sp. 394]